MTIMNNSANENLRELLQLTPEIEDELTGIVENKSELFLRYKDFPDTFKSHCKQAGPVLKYCVVSVEVKRKQKRIEGMSDRDTIRGKESDDLVRLNSSRADLHTSIKILKVIDN